MRKCAELKFGSDLLTVRQADIKEMYWSVLQSYEHIIQVGRGMTEEERNNQKWRNIMFSVLSLIKSTGADEAFTTVWKERRAEYEHMLQKYGSVFKIRPRGDLMSWRP